MGRSHDKAEDVPYWAVFTTYFGYAMLIVVGYVRDVFGRMFKRSQYAAPDGYAPLLVGYDDFYTRRLYHRVSDCWGRPIASAPGAWVDVVEREWTSDRRTLQVHSSKFRHCLNLGSYNYLGYGELPGGVDSAVTQTLRSRGVHSGACASAAGVQSDSVAALERTVAEFLGKEDAVVSGMGFATNAALIPSLVGPGCLIVSDALNHASIVVGARASGAKIRVFEHNDADSLERVLRSAIRDGQPDHHNQSSSSLSSSYRPWRKILVVVEGIYSMEGDVCELPSIIQVKKKYGAYLYLDEAHSIGALGRTGRGACEYHNVDTRDVDIMMGTFTKSFGAVGGYIAADRAVVSRLRATAAGALHASPMSPVCARHARWVFDQLAGRDGSHLGLRRIRALHENAVYMRRQLMSMGLLLYGNDDSPVIPIMLFNPGKVAAFSRECLKRQLAVVVVGFPATPLILSRARLCVSAAHTRADLDMALDVIDEVAELLQLRYAGESTYEPHGVSPTQDYVSRSVHSKDEQQLTAPQVKSAVTSSSVENGVLHRTMRKVVRQRSSCSGPPTIVTTADLQQQSAGALKPPRTLVMVNASPARTRQD